MKYDEGTPSKPILLEKFEIYVTQNGKASTTQQTEKAVIRRAGKLRNL